MVKEAYGFLKKEHGILPTWDAINNEFEISTIEDPGFLLRKIKRKMAEKMEPILDLLEHTITPDPNSFTDIYEIKCFTNSEREQALDLFRILMQHYRLCLETDILGDSTETVKAIRKIYDMWKEQKKP